MADVSGNSNWMEDVAKIRLNSNVKVVVIGGSGEVGWDPEISEKRWDPEKAEKRRKRMRERYGLFVKTMKRMGYADNRTMPRSINPEDVLEELLKEGGGVAGSWNVVKVTKLLHEYRLGQYRPLGPEVDQMFWKAVHDLGGGDDFSPAVTPEAIFDTFDDSTKEKTPLHIIRFMLGSHREDEKNDRLRLRLRRHHDGMFMEAESLDEPVPVPPYYKEVLDIKEKYGRIQKEHHRTFLKAIKHMGGHENLSNITAEALLKLILEELDPANEDFYWTLRNVQILLYSYHCGHYPIWTWKHHNKMLKAIEHLAAGDVFNEDRVNPKAVLEFMENDGDEDIDCLTNIWGVKDKLEYFRATLKNNPDDPIRFPKQPLPTKRPRLVSCS